MCSADNLHPASDKVSICMESVFALVDNLISANRAKLRVFREICVSANRAEFELPVFPQSHYRPGERAEVLVFIVESMAAARAIHGRCSSPCMAYPAEPSGSVRKGFNIGIQAWIKIFPKLQLIWKLGKPKICRGL